METTRHFTASIYVVNDGATVLHDHPRLDLWLPPGGHLQRDELPHKAALREAREETGLEVTLVQEPSGRRSESARPLPPPATVLLEDINVSPGGVGHQHVDFIYYGTVADRDVTPQAEEVVSPDRWKWFTAEELGRDDRFDPDVRELGIDAIRTVRTPP